jgi:DedD protein
MDQGLKERLVGAAVLIAIAVWLIPWVLDGPEAGPEPSVSSLQLPAAEEPMPMRTQTLRLGDEAESRVEAAPPSAATAPARETAAGAQPAEAESGSPAEAETTRAAARPEAERVATPPPEPARIATAPPKPSASATASGGEWTVQLGVFGDEANARRLAQRAGTFGYKAEVSSYRGEGRTLYRVRVGPQATRDAADAAASALRAHGVEARVVAAR